MRVAGVVPAVIYGRGVEENVEVAVQERAFVRAIPERAWYSTPVKLTVEGAAAEGFSPTVMIAEVQRDIVSGHLVSIDFHVVSAEETLRTQVPVVHVGDSPGVRRGGILEHLTHEVTVESKLADIPERLEVDISHLDIGERFRVSDLEAPEGVTILGAPGEVILLIAAPRVEAEAEAAPTGVVEEVPQPKRIGEEGEESE